MASRFANGAFQRLIDLTGAVAVCPGLRRWVDRFMAGRLFDLRERGIPNTTRAVAFHMQGP